MALTRILSPNPSLNVNLNPKPISFAIRRPLPFIHLQPSSIQLIVRASSNSDIGRVIEFEQADPTIEDITGGVSGGGDNLSGGGAGGGGRGERSGGEEEGKKKGGGMLMSQKLTLSYAAFIAAGGLIGFFKSGSQKSALAGVLSALVLGVVYKLLPIYPTIASMLGFAMSGALMEKMWSRFRISGKVFPAGIVCVVSFIMTVGYLHGIFRS